MKQTPLVQAHRLKLDDDLARDEGISLLATLVRFCEDPLRPRTEKGKFRPNPIFALIAILFLLFALTFFGFSLVKQ